MRERSVEIEKSNQLILSLENKITKLEEINDSLKSATKLSTRENVNVNQDKARFKRQILHAPNAIQTMHNEEAYLIIYCLNCIRCMQNSTFETGLRNILWTIIITGLSLNKPFV